ncbi:MAG TPA: hypothetical protein VFP98_03355, partial [Candidatus Polarisedimenticolia bacterium]|nr:hypothetical protein [Candidatus Polarisedimenticolia bacterium]
DTSKTDLIVAEVLRKSLLALVAWDRGDTVRAIALLEEATAEEEAMPLDFGPPVIVKPSHELLGELLLRLQRPEEAGRMFEKALERAPRRSLSLSGLARAAAATSATERLARACSELADIYAGADASVRPPEPCASRTVAGGGAAEPARSTAP